MYAFDPNKLAFSIPEIVQATGIGRTNIYGAMKSGALRARKHGKRTVILKTDLEAFLQSLAKYPCGGAP